MICVMLGKDLLQSLNRPLGVRQTCRTDLASRPQEGEGEGLWRCPASEKQTPPALALPSFFPQHSLLLLPGEWVPEELESEPGEGESGFDLQNWNGGGGKRSWSWSGAFRWGTSSGGASFFF